MSTPGEMALAMSRARDKILTDALAELFVVDVTTAELEMVGTVVGGVEIRSAISGAPLFKVKAPTMISDSKGPRFHIKSEWTDAGRALLKQAKELAGAE